MNNLIKSVLAVADGALTNFVSGMGTQRDKATANQFFAYRKSTFELDLIYESDWVAAKIIDKPAEDTFREGWYFDNLSPAKTKKLNKEIERLYVETHLLQAVKWARLYGKAYLLLASNDRADLQHPINPKSGLSYITALTTEQLKPIDNGFADRLDPALTGGFYDKPIYYQLTLGNTKAYDQKIHHSRVIELDFGVPILQRIYAEVERFASVNSNAGSLVHEAKVDVIKTPHLADNLASNLTNVVQRFGLVGQLKGNNGMVVLDKEEEYDSKSYSFAGLPELMREFAIQTAGAADMPYTVLFGQSPAGMNSTGEHDMRNYYDMVASLQKTLLRPALKRLFMLLGKAYLNGLVPEFVFNPLWQLDADTRSNVEKANSERDAKYIELGIITEAQVAKQLVEDGTYTVIDDAHLALLESLGVNHAEPASTTTKTSESE